MCLWPSRGDRLFVEESFFQQTIKLKVPFGIASGIIAAIHDDPLLQFTSEQRCL
jgi:hypothetical protein